MNIHRFEFNPYMDSIDIYISGCKHHPCKGCFNPELWPFTNGTNYKDILPKLKQKILDLDILKNIFIYGGEPLDQDINKLIDFLIFLNGFSLKVWLFTRYDYDYIPKKIFRYVDYLKLGKYDYTKLTDNHIQYGIKLASKNQYILKLS